MAVAKTRRGKGGPPKTPTEWSNSITRVAVAQTVQSAGYRRSQPSALQALTTISTYYIRSLTATASAGASRCGRAQCNLFDIVHALEELAFPHGFPGGSSVQPNLLSSSSILKDICRFMRCTREFLYAKPRPWRREPLLGLRMSDENLVSVIDQRIRRPGIPQWLPDFPDTGTECQLGTQRNELLWEEKWGDGKEIEERKEVNLLRSGDKRKRMLLMRSERVKFRIGAGKVKGLTKLDRSLKKRRLFGAEQPMICLLK